MKLRLALLTAFALLWAIPAVAQPVQQSGSVTPGHIPYWVTNGVIGDGGALSALSLTGGSTGINNVLPGYILFNNGGVLGAVVNSATINGVPCSLGASCSITASIPSMTVGTTLVLNGTGGYILSNNAGTLGNIPTTGSGSVVLANSPTLTTPTLGIATVTTLNGVTVASTSGTLDIANGKTLTDTSGIGGNLLLGATGGGFAAYGGASCTNQFLTAILSSGSPACANVTNTFLTAGTFSNITGVGTLTAGAVGAGFTIQAGNATWTGTIPVAQLPIATTSAFGAVKPDGSSILISAGVISAPGSGGGTVSSCPINNVGYFASMGTTLGCLATADNSVLVTSGSGVPSLGSTLPAAVQSNITSLGTIAGLTVTGSLTATGLVTNADLANPATTINGQTCTLGSTCTVPAAAGTLTGATLASGVTGSSLTSVGTLAGLTVTGSLTATGLVTNADLANDTITVNSTVCTLGGSCSPSATATSMTVAVTTVLSGTSGYLLSNNGGVLGNIATTGSGSAALATSPTIASPTFTGSITATGLVTLVDVATQAANTILVNATSGAASPTAQSVPSCSAATDALIWTTSTGIGCNTAITATALMGTAGEVPNGATGAFTATPTLGASGTLGSITFGNATSGLMTLRATTGALGTSTVYIPVPSSSPDTLVLLGTAQTFSANKYFAADVGIGTITPSSYLDVFSPSAVNQVVVPGPPYAAGALSNFVNGSNAAPITAVTPTVVISRLEAETTNLAGGENAGLFIVDIGHNAGNGTSSLNPNTVGLAVWTEQASGYNGDVVGIATYVTQNGTTGTYHNFAFGAFYAASAGASGTSAIADNPAVFNSSGADYPYSSFNITTTGGTLGALVQGGGTNLNTAGVMILASPQFDVGFVITGYSVKTTGFEDDSDDINVLNATGPHTYGINLASGTFSAASIAAPGFTVNGVNGDILYTGAAWTQYTPTITAGSGTITGATIASEVKYKVFGKTVVADGTVVITNVGSGSPSGALIVSLPASGPTTAASASVATGATTGAISVIGALASSATQWNFYTYSAGSLWTNGTVFSFSATYESD